MALHVIDETVTTARQSDDGVRTPGGRRHVARVVAHRRLRPSIEPGAGTPEGLGAVRLFTTGRHDRKRVVECRPGEVFAYVLERGCPCGTTRRSSR